MIARNVKEELFELIEELTMATAKYAIRYKGHGTAEEEHARMHEIKAKIEDMVNGL